MVVLLWKHTYTRPISHQEPDGARRQKCGQVTAKAQLLLHPEPKGDVARARGTPGTACFFVFQGVCIHSTSLVTFQASQWRRLLRFTNSWWRECRRSWQSSWCLIRTSQQKSHHHCVIWKKAHIKRKGTIAPKVGKDTVDWRDETWWRDAKYDWILVKRHTVQIPVFKLAVIWTSMHL